MVFSSIIFLFYFLPIVLLIYYIVPNKFKNIILLISSLIFYAYGEPKNIIIMITSIILTYIFGILISKANKKINKKIILTIAIILNVAILIYFKYINFIIENINLYLNKKIDLINVILPIGISFYTFQMLSYLIDVYKEKVKVQKNIIKLATYVSLFPQLVAGPIVRYSQIEKEIDNRRHTFEKFSLGVRKFVLGLGKKVLLANVLAILIENFLKCQTKDTLYYWLYGISNMLQIYLDFSGYSDMAIGLGKMFGFDFPENFNYPYIANTITDFWRRWHISLSTWFKDYIYIPLGGNKVSKIKWLRNILIVWILTGLWHGAKWNFVIWGLYFGIILIIEKIFLSKYLEKMPKIISKIYTLLIVMISFIIFSGTSKIEIIENLKGLIGLGNIKNTSIESLYYFKSYLIVLIISIIGATKIPKKIATNKKIEKIINIIEPIYLLIILIISTSYIVDGSYNPFIYFRF